MYVHIRVRTFTFDTKVNVDCEFLPVLHFQGLKQQVIFTSYKIKNSLKSLLKRKLINHFVTENRLVEETWACVNVCSQYDKSMCHNFRAFRRVRTPIKHLVKFMSCRMNHVKLFLFTVDDTTMIMMTRKHGH